MTRLIDAKDFDYRVSQQPMTEVFPNWKELPIEIQDAVCKHARHLHTMLEAQPVVDAVPVVHGHWCEGNSRQPCSVCCYRGMKSWNYCPNCGAKMDAQRLRKPVKEVTVHHIGDFEDKQESGLLEEE